MPQISTKSLSRSAACAVLLTVLLFVCPSRVAAIPISEYEQNIKDAIVSLEMLIPDEEDEIPDDYEEQFNQTLAKVRGTLPRNQTVESDGEVYNVDNTWLHQALDELRQEAYRSEIIEQIVARLTAMDTRVVERQQQTQTLESKDAAKKRLETILARPEYASEVKGPNALTRLLRDFAEWIKKFLPKRRTVQPGSGVWLEGIAKVLVALAAVALIVFLGRLLIGRFKRSKRIKPPKKKQPRIVLGERLEPEQSATDLLSEAEALARNGDLRAAIRKAYIALLVELGDRKIISLAQHKTNRDYLNAVRGLPPLHARMRGLTDSFERHWYGFADASQSDWQNFRDGYLAALHKGQ
jgi:Domain of unknown function (DUF4129)